jgi:hypothetical protein
MLFVQMSFAQMSLHANIIKPGGPPSGSGCYKTRYPNEEFNRTESSPSVSAPCLLGAGRELRFKALTKEPGKDLSLQYETSGLYYKHDNSSVIIK